MIDKCKRDEIDVDRCMFKGGDRSISICQCSISVSIGIGRTLLEVLRGSVDKLQSNELEATLLEAGDDLADESTLDAVGL